MVQSSLIGMGLILAVLCSLIGCFYFWCSCLRRFAVKNYVDDYPLRNDNDDDDDDQKVIIKLIDSEAKSSSTLQNRIITVHATRRKYEQTEPTINEETFNETFL